MADYGIIPSSGAFGLDWPDNHVLTQGKRGSISVAGWTEGNEGFPQQTFLGASLLNFNVMAGFGDTSSSLTLSVVNDEYNESDGLPLGQGDDVYHDGKKDTFRPPVVGTPVFFKFGKNFADIEQAFRRTYDTLYNTNTVFDIIFPEEETEGEITSIPGDNYFLRSFVGEGDTQVNTWVDKSALVDPYNPNRGKDHFVFGGILQSYTENRATNSGPTYSVQVSDPREILSNAVVLLNNYQGTTYNNKNLFNAYGFLEYDVSDELLEEFEGTDVFPNPDLISKNILTKEVDDTGNVTYVGDDTYNFTDKPFDLKNLPPIFPITGQGFSRRGDQGMPWYRINQALTALFNFNGVLPQEYVDAGFGGTIDFRGYKYVVDFTGIPLEKIPKMYFMDFDQINMLDLAQELCDIISHDLFVSLLPVINHPSAQWLYDYNQYQINNEEGDIRNIIAGVIRIDAIDRSKQPEYGAIKSYLDTLTDRGIDIENRDIGFELSNVVTDKFVVGAQEVNMFFFTNNKDRSDTQLRRKNDGLPNDYEILLEDQWKLETSLKQQILPFYGFLGKGAVTIPRGFGAYQQIMLDASSLMGVNGVGNYYIATELELRIALDSYLSWKNFLSGYSELYMEEISGDKKLYKASKEEYVKEHDDGITFAHDGMTEIVEKLDNFTPGGEHTEEWEEFKAEFIDGVRGDLNNIEKGVYGVSVPRCVFSSDKNHMGADGHPASPCAPPYGYPLYYKRAEKIGIVTAGVIRMNERSIEINTKLDKHKEALEGKGAFNGISTNDDNIVTTTNDTIKKLNEGNYTGLSPTIQKRVNSNQALAQQLAAEYSSLLDGYVATKNVIKGNAHLMKHISPLINEGVENSKKVYEFVKNVAEENLGKKFLVKIPKYCNLKYNEQISYTSPPPNTLPSQRAKFNVEIDEAPFGFKPQPVNSDIDYKDSPEFSLKLDMLMEQNLTSQFIGPVHVGRTEVFSHYLDEDAKGKYSYGALKGNFNPIAEKWDFNYEPNDQGGFFDFAIHDRNLSFTEASSLGDDELPLGTQQQLIPKDLTNFVDDNGRIKSFVRYDHSEYLDLSDVSKDSISQSVVTPGGFVQDILDQLDNVNPDHSSESDMSPDRFWDIKGGEHDPPNSVAFVACDIDEKFYMAPKTTVKVVDVYGQITEWVPHQFPYKLNITEDDNGCLVVRAKTQPFEPIFTLAGDGGRTGRHQVNNMDFVRSSDGVIDTEKSNLDSDHVYALITIPGRIKPTVESFHLDAMAYNKNPQAIKHNLTQDVVRGPAGFDVPRPLVLKRDPKFTVYCGSGNEVIINPELKYVQKVMRDAMNSADRDNLAHSASKSEPSPVYPDIVTLALTSMERCYGPWRSTAIETDRAKYSDIGGKIEFHKDENIAPWNYAGYQLMNEAGKLQAEFSNSLLLFSERGGFAIPEAPTGISLATALKSGGPLVTSIDVRIGDSIRTSVKMDLYTSSFGKLQKQKEIAIAKVARERQKIIDSNNAMMRKNFLGAGTRQDTRLTDIGNVLRRASSEAEQNLKTNNCVEFISQSVKGGIEETDKAMSAYLTNDETVGQQEKQLGLARARGQQLKNACFKLSQLNTAACNEESKDHPCVPQVNTAARKAQMGESSPELD